VYRSQAVRELTPPELIDLTRVSAARNEREAITGLMLYDSGRFFQWLEGPADSVNRVMGSIYNDRRHTNIELLNNQSAEARAFAGWNMKLATPGPAAKTWLDVIEPPGDIVERLRQNPEAAPSLLVNLVDIARPPIAEVPQHSGAASKLNRRTAAVLKSVILSAVLPKLLGGTSTAGQLIGLPASARSGELAELLIHGDHDAALELMRELRGAVRSNGRLYASVLEPAARNLGDLWDEDLCSEFDLTLGLVRLQMAVRLLAPDPYRPAHYHESQPAVLIVPEPGEIHRLGATLDGTVLGDAGWAPDCEFPKDDKALQDIVSGTWYDVLDLSLSAALRREHWLPRLSQTIEDARRASMNPDLVVIVGGRAFVEKSVCADVGADLASRTSGNVDRTIMKSVSVTSTVAESYEVAASPS
jgi:methanogenic corrinoid protein MtbC1